MADLLRAKAAEDYLSSLMDLTINSKPLINMLTMLADENIEHADVIVETIEKQLRDVGPEIKLTILYLIDCIVKNVGKEYRVLFTKKIANLFCEVFAKVNERTREKMFALRQTWNDVFPPTKLYTLDVKVKHIDPGWPITAPAPGTQNVVGAGTGGAPKAIHVNPNSIHINPKFLNSQTPEELTANLHRKQMELMALEKKKLQLEHVVHKKTEAVRSQNRVPVVGEQPVPISSLPPIPKIKASDRDPRLASKQGQPPAPMNKSSPTNKTSMPPSGTKSPSESGTSPTKKSSSESRRTARDHRSSRDPRSRDSRSRSSKNSSSSSGSGANTGSGNNNSSNTKNGGSTTSPTSREKKRQRSPNARSVKRPRDKTPETTMKKIGDPWKREIKKSPKLTENSSPRTESKIIDVDLRVPVPAQKDVDLRSIPVETMEISDSSDTEQSSTMTDLFGKNDLDLRTLNGGGGGGPAVASHPPKPAVASNLQSVRAKLAVEVSKQKDKLGRPLLYNQLPHDPVERKRKLSTTAAAAVVSGDIDLRQPLHSVSDEDYTAKMNIMLTQAQEQYQNNSIDNRQFEDLVQHVVAMNEAHKHRTMQPPTDPVIGPWNSSSSASSLMMSQQQQQQQQVLRPVQPVASDTVRTIQIDSIPRDIRFYGEVAVIFMSDDDPRRIGFENGTRQLAISGAEPALLNFNDDYKPIVVNGHIHQVRFGAPSRELYIDKLPYECLFGGPPLPILIDGNLHTVTVNGPEPKVKIGDTCKELVAGKVQMIIDGIHSVPMYLDAEVQTFSYNDAMHTVQLADYFSTVIIDGVPLKQKIDYGGLPQSFKLGNKNSFIRFSTLPKGVICGQPPVIAVPEEKSADQLLSLPSAVNPSSIDALISSLVSSGVLKNLPTPEQQAPPQQQHQPRKPARSSSPPAPIQRRHHDVRIDLDRPSTIKKRNNAAVEALFSGMQCSSCGVRFTKEQTVKYSLHLDWHFRQNRRDRGALQKAFSRKWYYDVSDWIQYEEIEDLEEREQNFFEKHGTVVEVNDEDTPNTPNIVTCLAGPKGAEETCEVCHDKFEYFFNEDTEDWHLKNAMRLDDKTYHPTCYDDHKAAEERRAQKAEEETEESTNEESKVEEEEEYVPEDTQLERMDEDEDDDVIALPPEKPTITEILDDEDDENGYTLNEIEDTTAVDSPKPPETKKPTETEVVIDTTEIKVKEEKLDDTDEAFDAFEDVGTMEGDPEVIDSMIIDDEPSNLSVPDTTVPSPPPQTTTASIDGNLSMTYAPPITVQKIRINITKPLTQLATAPEHQKEDELTNAGDEEPETEVEPTFTLKSSMSDVEFERHATQSSRAEASGLCCIM